MFFLAGLVAREAVYTRVLVGVRPRVVWRLLAETAIVLAFLWRAGRGAAGAAARDLENTSPVARQRRGVLGRRCQRGGAIS